MMEKGVQSSSKAYLNAIGNGALPSRQSKDKQQFNRSKGTSVCHRKMKNASNWLQRHESRTESPNGSEDLSDINDSEIAGYLHNEKEMQFKKLLWEILNKKYLKGMKLKRARKVKKVTPADKAVKIAGPTGTKERLSSKINYDALNKLMDEETGEVPGKVDKGKQPNRYYDDPQTYANSVLETSSYRTSEENDNLEHQNEDTEYSDADNGHYKESVYYEDEHDIGYEEGSYYEDEHDFGAVEDYD